MNSKYTLFIAITMTLLAAFFWQWSRHDIYLEERAFGAAVCDNHICESSSERSATMSNYLHDASDHRSYAILFASIAALTSLAACADIIRTRTK